MSLSAQITALAAAVRGKINLMVPRLLPAGGATGQVLSKSSAADYSAGWTTAAAGPTTPATTTVQGIPVFSTTTGSALGISQITVTPVGALQTIGNGSTGFAPGARGAGSVDLQVERAATSDVAGGICSTISGGGGNSTLSDYSTIGGGKSNGTAASSPYGTVAGGNNNFISAGYGTVAGGYNNFMQSAYGAIGGGSSNQINGNYGTVSGGYRNYANAAYSAVPGGYGAIGRRFGEISHSAGIYSVLGDRQMSQLPLARVTTSAALTNMSPSGFGLGNQGVTDSVFLTANSAVKFTGLVTATAVGGADEAEWTIAAYMKRAASGIPTILSSSVTPGFSTSGAATWTVALAVDTVNNGLAVNITGAAGVTIRWNGRLDLLETVF